MGMPMWAPDEIRGPWLRANREQWRRRAAGEGYIYVAERIGTDLIKIGFSLNPEKRMLALKIDYRDDFRLMGYVPGSNLLEKQLHSVLWRALGKTERSEFYQKDQLYSWLFGRAAA